MRAQGHRPGDGRGGGARHGAGWPPGLGCRGGTGRVMRGRDGPVRVAGRALRSPGRRVFRTCARKLACRSTACACVECELGEKRQQGGRAYRWPMRQARLRREESGRGIVIGDAQAAIGVLAGGEWRCEGKVEGFIELRDLRPDSIWMQRVDSSGRPFVARGRDAVPASRGNPRSPGLIRPTRRERSAAPGKVKCGVTEGPCKTPPRRHRPAGPAWPGLRGRACAARPYGMTPQATRPPPPPSGMGWSL